MRGVRRMNCDICLGVSKYAQGQNRWKTDYWPLLESYVGCTIVRGV